MARISGIQLRLALDTVRRVVMLQILLTCCMSRRLGRQRYIPLGTAEPRRDLPPCRDAITACVSWFFQYLRRHGASGSCAPSRPSNVLPCTCDQVVCPRSRRHGAAGRCSQMGVCDVQAEVVEAANAAFPKAARIAAGFTTRETIRGQSAYRCGSSYLAGARVHGVF